MEWTKTCLILLPGGQRDRFFERSRRHFLKPYLGECVRRKMRRTQNDNKQLLLTTNAAATGEREATMERDQINKRVSSLGVCTPRST